MATPDEIIINEYLELDKKILRAVNKILKDSQSRQTVAQFVMSEEFDRMIYDLGLEETLVKYEASLLNSAVTHTRLINRFIDAEAKAQTLSSAETVLRQAKRFAAQGMNDASIKIFQDTLIDQITSGSSRAEILASMESIPLTTTQLQTNIHTAYSSVNRSLTSLAFSDQPDQKFSYAGGVIPTSSEQCAWLYINQRKTGYTKAEIDAGIKTPHGDINWQGRIPNFNCIHEWIPTDVQEEPTKRDEKLADQILES